jgi:hypothetical protein
MTDLETQLRRYASDVLDRHVKPAKASQAAEQRHALNEEPRPRRRIRVLASVTVGVVAVSAITAWLMMRTGSDDPRVAVGAREPTASAPDGRVVREVIDYTQSAEITCPSGSPSVEGTFDQMRFEIWGSEAMGRWRQTVTYPDGSTRDLILVDSPTSPTVSYTRGVTLGRTYSCAGVGAVLHASGQDSVAALNPVGVSSRARMPPVREYRTLGAERVAGTYTDSRERTVELWRRTSDAFTSVDGEQRPLRQTREWFVDPASDRVLERRFAESIEGIGTVSSTSTLLARGRVKPPRELFDTTGYVETIEGGDPDARITLTHDDRIEPVTQLGTNWIWPARPHAESPEDLARRFATEVLGWTQFEISTEGPTVLTEDGNRIVLGTLTDDARRQTLFAVGTADKQGQVESISVAAAPGHTTALNLPDGTGAHSVDVLIRTRNSMRAWHTELADSKKQIVLNMDANDVRTVLILFKDASGKVLTANGFTIRPLDAATLDGPSL